jgi:hypothetical protein
MSDLTEPDVIGQLKASLKEAGQAALDLSVTSRKGPAYKKLREHLLLVEGCCRQLSAMREDTRWLNIGMLMHKAHELSGGWLRGFKHPITGMRIAVSIKTRNPLFIKLAENLAFLHETADNLLMKRTGVLGPILPALPIAERRVGAPVRVSVPPAMQKMPSGILLPGTVH